METEDGADREALLRRAIRLKRAAARSKTGLEPRPEHEQPLLGEMQRSLWVLHRLDPSSAAYNLVSAFRVSAPLDPARLEGALAQVVARHRLLRSTFRVEGERVLQVVHPPERLPVQSLEVEESEVLSVAVREARLPFDLESGPLVRMVLVGDRAGRERILMLVLHHILADELSLGLLWQELAAAYEGLDPEAAVEAPGLQYDDYVYRLEKRAADERERHLAYWKERLQPPPEDLALPFERTTPLTDGPAGGWRSRTVGSDLEPEIRRLATRLECTPFSIYAFTFRLLLQRYQRQRSFAFAFPASTRSHPATAKMIGYFLNPLVLCASIDEEAAVEQAIRELDAEIREALSHASVPFDLLAESFAEPRRDRHPLFQTMLVYRQKSSPPSLGAAELESIDLDLGEAKFDLTLFVSDGEAGIELAVEYRPDRFEAIWMEKLLGHYETLLSHLTDDLERPVELLEMLADDERRQLDAWQGGPLATAAERSSPLLPEQTLERARSVAGTAVVCGGRRWSYAELGQQAAGVAHELIGRGVAPGDRVGLFLDRSELMIAGLLGSQWTGAAYVPLDPGYPAARHRPVLEDADVEAVLTTSLLRGRLPDGDWQVLVIDRLGSAAGTPLEPPTIEPRSPAYLLYTSGSTGRPKGVVVSHQALRASTAARFLYYETSPERFLLLPSIAFDSSVAGLFWTLALGGTLVVPTDDEARDARRLARLVAEEGVDTLLGIPSLYAQMLKSGPQHLRSLRTAIVAGEICPPQLVREHFRSLPQTRLFNEYGPTEATVWATVHEATEEDGDRPVAIGRPVPGVRVEVRDERGRPVPAGVAGEAWIAGPTVAEGYWRRPEQTAERFVLPSGESATERRYRTGDLVSWSADGRLLFAGRLDEQIKLRGFRIEPGEIESALLDLEGVDEAAVVARATALATPSGDEPPRQLVAFVRTVDHRDVRPDAASTWRRSLAERLPGHMVPSRIVELPELPRLSNGKVDRRRLAALPLEEPAEAPSAVVRPAANEVEATLVALWRSLLDRQLIGTDDNFFELGGHSLLVVELTDAIERDLGVELAAAEVFQHPTVRGLAHCIQERRPGEASRYAHLFPIQPRGDGSPFVMSIPHVFTDMLAQRFRGERPVYGLRGVGLRREGNRGRWRTMTELAEELVDEIGRRFPGQAPFMAGYSFGATMAVEATRLMEERSLPVRHLYLVAPMPLDFYRLGPLRLQLAGLRQPLDELSPRQALARFARQSHPLTRRFYRGASWLLLVRPWRQLLCAVGRLRQGAGLPLTESILYADVRLERFRLHRGYDPRPLETPTTIFNPMETESDAAATWRPWLRGPLTVVPTPDPHLDEASIERAKRVILEHWQDLGEVENR